MLALDVLEPRLYSKILPQKYKQKLFLDFIKGFDQ